MFLQTASGTEIALIFGLLAIMFLGALIHGHFIEEPRKKRELEKMYKESDERSKNEIKEANEWLNSNQEKVSLQGRISDALEELGENTPSCSKCDSNEIQIWESSKSHLVLRCTTCKKKTKPIKVILENEKISFSELMTKYIKFVEYAHRDYVNTNRILQNHLLDKVIKWDFGNLRAGQPLFRAITFKSNPNLDTNEGKYDDIKNDEPSRRIPQKVMDMVWNRDGGKCVGCGSNQKLEFDHIIPFSKGGANTYRNIQLLCENCNRTKSDKIG